ncbi:hypothetical protein LINGRAHAP2_LOCUS4267, partial [Linum grandiflorum]
PPYFLEEVLFYVGANSLTDLLNCKKTFTLFSELASNLCVLQNVTLLGTHFRHKSFKLHQKNNFLKFIARCINNNIEVLFCRGMEDYFWRDGRITKLRAAAKKGMKEARYAYGIFSLLTEEHPTSVEEALTVLYGLRKVDDINTCRKTTKYVVQINMIVAVVYVYKTHRLFKRLERNIDYERCRCKLVDRSLRSFTKNSNFGWLENKDQVIDLVDSDLCYLCFWEFEACVLLEICLG